MKWPNHTDYQDAMQNPQVCFDQPDLKAGQAASDMLGLPRVMSGNFASVYELVTGDKRWAVRCFVRQVAGQQGRYARLGQHLNSLTLPWLVKFDFIQKGILVQGEWYPIVKMEWVEGLPINNYVDERANDPDAIKSLADQFRVLVRDLRANKLAHGDFQHGNIMVTPAGELRLVDYDGMYCPAFGKGRSPELGHVNFQHPLRTAEFYDESLDNFSALVVYTSLLALASDPGLWRDFYTGDNLLFTSQDFRNTQHSKLFQRLGLSANPEVQQLSALLEQCSRSPIAKTPWFEESVAAAKNGSLNKSIEELQSATATAGPGSEGWWEGAPPEEVTGSRAATGSRPAATPITAHGPSTEQAREATRPSSAPTAAGTRPSASAGGSRPSAGPAGTRVSPPGSGPYINQDYMPGQPGATAESGGSGKIKLAAGAMIILALICYIIIKSRSSAPHSATIDPLEETGR